MTKAERERYEEDSDDPPAREKSYGRSRYGYWPLKNSSTHIRLVSRVRGRTSRRWTIQTFELDKAPKFDAISYTWGSRSAKWDIDVDGDKLFVSQSVYAIFESIDIGGGGHNPLWLDQVCIDQKNNEERSQQVAIMGDIYRAAESVLIWLSVVPRGDTIRVSNKSRFPGSRVLFGESRKRKMVDELTQIAIDPYWTRLWIIQEIVLAEKVYVWMGRENGRLPWHAFKDLFSMPLAENIEVPARLGWFFRNVGAGKQSFIQFDELVHPFSSSNCSDPRDKVYGLQGLLAPDHRLEVDYSKSKPEVLTDAVKLMAEQWNRPDEYRELIHRCLKLGSNMMPEVMNLPDLFDHVELLSRAAKDTSMDPEARKQAIVKGFEVLVASFRESEEDA